MAVRIEFHTGVADPELFACRLLRKALGAGARVVVTAPLHRLAALDERLWTFDPHSFVPHVRVPGPADALATRTPVWLCSALPPVSAARPSVLVNLCADGPEGADDFERVIEIVGTDAAERAEARSRWRRYESWGATPVHHAAAD